uniref:DUF4220 domain-containing protein n=1 Tax=Oryza rufipogon TaxID=4529 RepID=A0A0E0N4T8_ORYRU
MFLMSLALAAAHIAMAYRASCRERRRLLVYRIDIEAIPIRVFERFWRTIEAYACRPFTGHDNGQKNTTSPHATKAMVERWPADEGGTRHCRFLPPLAAAQGAKKATAESEEIKVAIAYKLETIVNVIVFYLYDKYNVYLGITASSKSNLQFIEHRRMRHRREYRCHMVVVKVVLAVAFIDIVVFVVGGLGGSSPPADGQATTPTKAPPRGFIYIDSNGDDDGDGHSDGDGGRAANYTRGDGRNGRANS